ncbi:Uma2 family endonuclease [Nocardia higoensis]|uniref:Uma2 family endonuclease n=1 Tax=Nocardia higoensis TaxID=228599 RepID=A0ABS0D8H8_9NOCA|nr:Uma2 family endonuclease [Nocardia higoensis]MBF6354774.1 Uma2 family endonuclease [Nocardia higoensis]
MSERRVTPGAGRGPYSTDDLHALPGRGRDYELEDGWLVEVDRGARHDHVVRRMARSLDRAADLALHVCIGGGWEVGTSSGVRKPDIVVVPREVIRHALVADPPRVLAGDQVRLAVEVIAPATASERTDRVRKVREYAAAGIPEYWIVEHHPRARVHRLVLDDGIYHARSVVDPGSVLIAEVGQVNGFRVVMDPAELLEI